MASLLQSSYIIRVCLQQGFGMFSYKTAVFDDSNADENRFDDLASDQLAENPED